MNNNNQNNLNNNIPDDKNNTNFSQNVNATPNENKINSKITRNQANRQLNNNFKLANGMPHNNPTLSKPDNDLATPNTNQQNPVSKTATNKIGNKVLNKMGLKGKLASMALNKLQNKSNNNTSTPATLLNRKKGLGIGSRLLGSSLGNEEEKTEESGDESNNIQDDAIEVANTVVNTSRIVMLLIKLAPVLIPVVFVFFAIIIIIAILEDPIGATLAALGLDTHKTSNPQYIYDINETAELAEAEREYYNKLYETIDAYQEEYGVNLDKYLLHSALIYRYYISDDFNENLFTDSSQITDVNENISSVSVDYSDATSKIGVVASLMIEENNGSYITDSDADGPIYENFVNSEFLTTYYASLLYNDSEEAKKQIVDAIFYFAEMMDYMMNGDQKSMVISGESIVYLQTCAYSSQTHYQTKTINNFTVYDNPLTNEGTDYPSYLSITDYIKGVLMTEVGRYISEEYTEGLKALGIVALSFMLEDNLSGFNLKTGEFYFPTGNCRQVACDPNNGCTYLKGKTIGKYGTAFVGLNRFGATTGQHRPLSDEKNAFLDEILTPIFGKVIVKAGVTSDTFQGSSDVVSLHHYASLKEADCVAGHCMGQTEAMADAANGFTYEQILAKYYYDIDYDIIDIQEGLYHTSSGEYNGTIQLNEDYHYHQGDSPWGSQKLCDSGNISSNGCNITSAAIAISLLTNNRVTPSVLNNRQKEISTCRQSSRPQMIMDFAKLYGLTATEVKKSDNLAVHNMLSKLATGNYVAIARLAPNSGRYDTDGGHYIAIVGVKSENGRDKVLVWDPGSRSSSRDNYWADLNDDLIQYLRSDYSFILIGRQ